MDGGTAETGGDERMSGETAAGCLQLDLGDTGTYVSSLAKESFLF